VGCASSPLLHIRIERRNPNWQHEAKKRKSIRLYSKSRLIAKLRQVDAFTIFRLARTAGVSLPGKTKYLQQVYTIYNGGSRRAALPLKF